MKVRVIGAGLSGAEAINYLAKRGYEVEVFEMKRRSPNPAQHSQNYAELVCSNSLKSSSETNACGLLKHELVCLDSIMMEAAQVAKVPSGQDLAVDRELFSSYITSKITSFSNVTFIDEEFCRLPGDDIPTIIATGPLTSPALLNSLEEELGAKSLSFYDASAPLVYGSSLDMNKLFYKSRYDKGDGRYLNSPLSKDEYYSFNNALLKAEKAILHDFDHFEGCLPLEVMAARGPETLARGPLKAIGLDEDIEPKPYAIVQLRQDDVAESLYSLVGFQTNLTYAAQKEVFRMIPGLSDAKFARFGLMHKNAYLLSPVVLNRDLSLKKRPSVYIAGQLTGVEGYVESAATGLLAAIYLDMRLNNNYEEIPLTTVCGSLVNYIAMASKNHFQPINATYGIMITKGRKSKEECYTTSIEDIKAWQERRKR